MTASLAEKKAKRTRKQDDAASASTGSTGSRGSGTARRPAKRGVAAVQAEDDDNESYADTSTLPSYSEALTMLRYRHNTKEGFEQLIVGRENVEDELRTKGTEGMGFLQAGSTPSLVGGVSQDEDAGEWRVQYHVGSNPENKRRCKAARLKVEVKLAKLVNDLEEKPAFIKSILKTSQNVPQVKKGGTSRNSVCVATKKLVHLVTKKPVRTRRREDVQSDLVLVPKLANPTDRSPSGDEIAAHKADWSPPGGEIAEKRYNMKHISVALVEGEHPNQKTALIKYSKLMRSKGRHTLDRHCEILGLFWLLGIF